jgi:iron complex transport system substrate-binding protein
VLSKGVIQILLLSLIFLHLFLPHTAPGGKKVEQENETGPAEASGIDYFSDKSVIQYAEGFSVEYHRNYKLVTVHNPWPRASRSLKYLLVQRGTPRPTGYRDSVVIEIPVEHVVTLSTTYLAYMDMLGVTDYIIGHDDFKYVCTPSVREKIEEGLISEVGEGSRANVELIIEMEPDLIMTFHTGNEQDAYPKLIEAGLPVIINAEYLEKQPLAMAEWIKFIALFFNKEGEAEELFSEIAFQYHQLSGQAASVGQRPTVLLGAPFQGTWWMAGGGSYSARLLEHAGAEYLWKDNNDTGAIPLDIESVYVRAADADFWLNTGTWETRNDALEHDLRFTEFRAYREGNMYNNNRRTNGLGGNDFWESGRANPHKVLADLVAIFHPELLPDHEYVYYKKLN